MYASDGKAGFTPCREDNTLEVRASGSVNISTQRAHGNITSYGSTRKVSSLRKEIHEHRNSKAHKEASNILETAKKEVLLNSNQGCGSGYFSNASASVSTNKKRKNDRWQFF